MSDNANQVSIQLINLLIKCLKSGCRKVGLIIYNLKRNSNTSFCNFPNCDLVEGTDKGAITNCQLVLTFK